MAECVHGRTEPHRVGGPLGDRCSGGVKYMLAPQGEERVTTREYSSSFQAPRDPTIEAAIERATRKMHENLNRDLWAGPEQIGYCHVPAPLLVALWNRFWGHTRWRWDWPTRIAVYAEDRGIEGLAAIVEDEDDDA